MFKWKRTPWLAALALGAVLALAGGCGDDDDDDDGGDGDEVNLRSGTWTLVSTTTTNPSQCPGAGTETEDIEICESDSDSAFVPELGDCDFDVDGDEFTFHCTAAETFEGCTLTVHFDGEGSFTETSYTSTVMFFTTVSPSTPACNEFANPCTTTVHQTGTWKNDTADCDDKPTVPAAAALKRMARLAGTH